ncbi:copper resistance protein CopZ [Vibrio natriegens]|jgi:copper(I)-binding protein|uniref:copper chaperone PCu(A)C n=1 Tax=Vibrio natriegens TaxID=691 RepID=UPI00080461C2|nr:copper chaperone PCu(A)C [Vibrio natriegens]ANQ24308.1 copper resistance protein CopZ [Vibrio natriegens]
MLKQIKTLAITFAALIMSPVSLAHEYEAGQIHIDHPWSREAPPNAPVIGGFLQLNNHGEKEDALIAAESPIAARIELHNHIMEDGVMKMVKVSEISVPAKGTVALEPGSFHLMIFNPNQTLKEGDRFPMTLTFKNAGKVDVEIAVENKGHMEKHMNH